MCGESRTVAGAGDSFAVDYRKEVLAEAAWGNRSFVGAIDQTKCANLPEVFSGAIVPK